MACPADKKRTRIIAAFRGLCKPNLRLCVNPRLSCFVYPYLRKERSD